MSVRLFGGKFSFPLELDLCWDVLGVKSFVVKTSAGLVALGRVELGASPLRVSLAVTFGLDGAVHGDFVGGYTCVVIGRMRDRYGRDHDSCGPVLEGVTTLL